MSAGWAAGHRLSVLDGSWCAFRELNVRGRRCGCAAVDSAGGGVGSTEAESFDGGPGAEEPVEAGCVADQPHGDAAGRRRIMAGMRMTLWKNRRNSMRM